MTDGVQDSDLGLFFQEASERTGDGSVIMDEPPVEDWEAEKALEFFDGCGDGPVLNGGYLPLVHLDATVVDVVSKELHWGLVEWAFFSFEEHMIFSQAFQDLRNVVAMFGHTPGVDQDVIYVDE